MKVLVSSDMGYPYLGGAERAVLTISKKLVEMGHDVTWVCSRINDTKLEENYKGVNIKRVSIPFPQSYASTRKFYPINSIRTLLKEAKDSDILQFCTFIGALNGKLVGKLSKRPYFCQTWEMFGELWDIFSDPITANINKRLERYVANSFPFYIAVSAYTKKRLVQYGAPRNRVEINYLAVDHKNIYPSKPKFRIKRRVNIGWTGRMKLSESKNLTTLLKAFKMVKEQVDAVLQLGGTGFDSLVPLIKELGLKIGKDVIYNGRMPEEDMKRFYSSLDVYALPSLSEGFGLVALESQACGTPVVCFNIGSLPEIVVHKRTGLLIKERSSKAFAEGIIEAVNRKFKKKTLTRHAKKYTWEKTAERQVKAYKRMIKN